MGALYHVVIVFTLGHSTIWDIYGHCGRRKREGLSGTGNAPARKWHTLLILTTHWPGLAIPHLGESGTGDPRRGEEVEYLETSTNDYHIDSNLRIHHLICGRTLKTEHIDAWHVSVLYQYHGILLRNLIISRLFFKSTRLRYSKGGKKRHVMERLLWVLYSSVFQYLG